MSGKKQVLSACSKYEARVRCCSSRDHPRGSEKQKRINISIVADPEPSIIKQKQYRV
jgi:hypothetical protein